MSREDRLNELHNEGQKDAQDRNYDPPHGIAEDLITWDDDGMRRIREDNEAYKSGYENGKKNRD